MATMTDQTLEIYFDGKAVENHEMDLRVLAPSLTSFADAIDEYTNQFYPMMDVSINIKATEAGSFDVYLELLGVVAAGLDAFGAKDPAAIAKGLLAVLRIVAQRVKSTGSASPNDSETYKEAHKKVKVNFGGDKNFEYSKDSYLASRNGKIVNSLGHAAMPSTLEGYRPVRFSRPKSEDAVFVEPDVAEAMQDVAVSDQKLAPATQEITLQIESPSKSSAKWRFRNDDATFYAEIKDDAFLDLWESRKFPYLPGDMLSVTLVTEQNVVDGVLKAGKRTITDVHKYIPLERDQAFEGLEN